jgi:hypothetical protein
LQGIFTHIMLLWRVSSLKRFTYNGLGL